MGTTMNAQIRIMQWAEQHCLQHRIPPCKITRQVLCRIANRIDQLANSYLTMVTFACIPGRL
jgi:hypothetical protein